METIQKIEFHNGTKEELLPNMTNDFPYIASYAELDKYPNRYVPWHWHKEIEIFYMQSGTLIYYTSDGKYTFLQGSGGFVNSNILHTTKVIGETNTVQLLHIFDSSIISGQKDGKIDIDYVKPFINSNQIKIIPLYPDNINHTVLLEAISKSFNIHENDFAYELKLRNALSEIWFRLLELSSNFIENEKSNKGNNDKIRLMMIYIHEHYFEKLKISSIANSAFVSERVCYRIFKECIHMSPMEYLNSYRLQKACTMLIESSKPITLIGYECGLGTSSHFATVFKHQFGCTPLDYRKKWQNNDV